MSGGNGVSTGGRRALGLIGGWILGAVLLFAAWGKGIDPERFAEQIRYEGLELLLPAALLAALMVALEAGLGAALLLGMRQRWIVLPASALVALFVFLTSRTYWRFSQGLIDESEACGCFGNLVARSPAVAFWQDLLLLVPPMVLIWLGGRVSRRGGRLLPATAAAATLAGGILAWAAPSLPLDDLATRLRPGVDVADLCAGSIEDEGSRLCLPTLMLELLEGEHLVTIGDLEDEGFGPLVEGLNRLTREGGVPFRVITASEQLAQTAFFWQWGPAFEIREVPEALLRPLYRELPRSFRVVDGRVEETWPGLPPGVQEIVDE